MRGISSLPYNKVRRQQMKCFALVHCNLTLKILLSWLPPWCLLVKMFMTWLDLYNSTLLFMPLSLCFERLVIVWNMNISSGLFIMFCLGSWKLSLYCYSVGKRNVLLIFFVLDGFLLVDMHGCIPILWFSPLSVHSNQLHKDFVNRGSMWLWTAVVLSQFHLKFLSYGED